MDVFVSRSGNKLTTSVYRKKTHTDRYINYQSYHHPRVKTGTIACLRKRAERLCGDGKLKDERNHLQETFEANGYPVDLVRKTLFKHTTQRRAEEGGEEEKWDILCLPYIQGLTESIEKRTKDLQVRVVSKTCCTLRKLLMKVKSPRDRNNIKGVIYSIPCKCGKEYVGETGRTLHQRMMEHK